MAHYGLMVLQAHNNGPNGAAGQDGATGAQGPTGAAGLNGSDGQDGATGAQGPTNNGLNVTLMVKWVL